MRLNGGLRLPKVTREKTRAGPCRVRVDRDPGRQTRDRDKAQPDSDDLLLSTFKAFAAPFHRPLVALFHLLLLLFSFDLQVPAARLSRLPAFSHIHL